MSNQDLTDIQQIIDTDIRRQLLNRVNGDRRYALVSMTIIDLVRDIFTGLNSVWEHPDNITYAFWQITDTVNELNNCRRIISVLSNKYNVCLIPGLTDRRTGLATYTNEERRFIYVVRNMSCDDIKILLKRAKVKYDVEHNMRIRGDTYREVFIVGQWVAHAIETHSYGGMTGIEMYDYIKRMKPDDYDIIATRTNWF